MGGEEAFDRVAGDVVLGAALFDPLLVGEPVGKRRVQVLAGADAAGGVFFAEEAAARSDLRDRIHGQRGVGDLDGAVEAPHHGGDLVVDHRLRQVHGVVRVDEAPARDDVGAGGADAGDLERLLVAGLQPRVLAVGGESGVERGHAQVVTDLGGHGAHEGALDAAQREGGAPHVEDPGAEAEDEPGSGSRDLQSGGDAEELGQPLHDRARQGHG